MITAFTAAKYEIEIECLAGTLINAFSKHGQSLQCYMLNNSGKQIKQNKIQTNNPPKKEPTKQINKPL